MTRDTCKRCPDTSHMAVPVGFEPTDGLHHHMFSRHAPSAARTRYRRLLYATAPRPTNLRGASDHGRKTAMAASSQPSITGALG